MLLIIFRKPHLLYGLSLGRAFSTTSCICKATGPLPTFNPTSNPELDAKLQFIREEHFIPSHLLQRHRNLIYRKKNHSILNEEPLNVEVSGTPITLLPKERQVSVPLKAVSQAMSLMKEPTDLDALPGLIEGFAQTKMSLRPAQLEKMARILTLSCRWDLIMKIARGAKTYPHGFKFTTPVAREFMRGLRIRNQLPVKNEVIKSICDGEELLQMFGSTQYKKDPTLRLGRDPVIVGTLLAMVSSRDIRFYDGKDETGIIKKCVYRLQEAWKGVVLDLGLVNGNTKSIDTAKEALVDYTPVSEGMKEAQSILAGSDLESWLMTESKKLDDALKSWNSFLEDQNRAHGRTPALYARISAEFSKNISSEER
ncbi:hypothetical protein EDC01DRAFT_728412 [Geopyxis carbonaria]|nr:hypothetical protein EDC01DRAFT_728412 [Geopyxis carbonaria]